MPIILLLNKINVFKLLKVFMLPPIILILCSSCADLFTFMFPSQVPLHMYSPESIVGLDINMTARAYPLAVYVGKLGMSLHPQYVPPFSDHLSQIPEVYLPALTWFDMLMDAEVVSTNP